MWHINKEKRYEYTRNLIESRMLIGKTKNEVVKILGDDADTSKVGRLGYDIGSQPEITGVDPGYLIINFKNDRADSVIEYHR